MPIAPYDGAAEFEVEKLEDLLALFGDEEYLKVSSERFCYMIHFLCCIEILLTLRLMFLFVGLCVIPLSIGALKWKIRHREQNAVPDEANFLDRSSVTMMVGENQTKYQRA